MRGVGRCYGVCEAKEESSWVMGLFEHRQDSVILAGTKSTFCKSILRWLSSPLAVLPMLWAGVCQGHARRAVRHPGTRDMVYWNPRHRALFGLARIIETTIGRGVMTSALLQPQLASRPASSHANKRGRASGGGLHLRWAHDFLRAPESCRSCMCGATWRHQRGSSQRTRRRYYSMETGMRPWPQKRCSTVPGLLRSLPMAGT